MLTLLCAAALSHAFTIPHRVRRTTMAGRSPSSSPSICGMTPPTNDDNDNNNNNDIPREIGSSSYESSVDWDAEWKKVVQDQKQGKTTRPGGGYYKTEAEIKAIQAANKAAFEAQKVKANLPTWQMLQGDWKVCVCVCLHYNVRPVVDATPLIFWRNSDIVLFFVLLVLDWRLGVH